MNLSLLLRRPRADRIVVRVVDPPRPVVLLALNGYRRWLSPHTTRCPSTPSCSAYAVAVVRRFGARRGLRLAAARLRRCGLRQAQGDGARPVAPRS